jgi:hypothetical protein
MILENKIQAKSIQGVLDELNLIILKKNETDLAECDPGNFTQIYQYAFVQEQVKNSMEISTSLSQNKVSLDKNLKVLVLFEDQTNGFSDVVRNMFNKIGVCIEEKSLFCEEDFSNYDKIFLCFKQYGRITTPFCARIEKLGQEYGTFFYNFHDNLF